MNSSDPFRCFHHFAESVADTASGLGLPAVSGPANREKIFLAVSGGADSVAMFRCAMRLGGVTPDRLIVAHFDHGIRADSASDAAWVRRLAEAAGVRCVIGTWNPPAGDGNGDGGGVDSEDTLRRARYRFLEREARRLGGGVVWTAHTLDDQIETVLHRVLRGTGLRGLAGIPLTRPLHDGPDDNDNGESMEKMKKIRIFRPMLQIDRAAIVDFLREIGQTWREDTTNAATDYTRNRIRHELLPLIESDYAPGVRRSLARLASLADDTVRRLDARVDRWYPQVVRIVEEPAAPDAPMAASGMAVGGMVRVDRAALIRLDATPDAVPDAELIRELLRRIWRERRWPQRAMGFDHWTALATMLYTGSPRRRMFPGGILATVRRNTLELTPPRTPTK